MRQSVARSRPRIKSIRQALCRERIQKCSPRAACTDLRSAPHRSDKATTRRRSTPSIGRAETLLADRRVKAHERLACSLVHFVGLAPQRGKLCFESVRRSLRQLLRFRLCTRSASRLARLPGFREATDLAPADRSRAGEDPISRPARPSGALQQAGPAPRVHSVEHPRLPAATLGIEKRTAHGSSTREKRIEGDELARPPRNTHEEGSMRAGWPGATPHLVITEASQPACSHFFLIPPLLHTFPRLSSRRTDHTGAWECQPLGWPMEGAHGSLAHTRSWSFLMKNKNKNCSLLRVARSA